MHASKTLVQHFVEACNQHNLAELAHSIAPDYIQHNPTIPQGLVGLQDGLRDFLTIFPDLRVTIEDLVADGDRIAGRFHWRGTHSAEIFGIPATYKMAEWQSSDFWRVAENKLVEHWDVVDWSGLIQQLQSNT